MCGGRKSWLVEVARYGVTVRVLGGRAARLNTSVWRGEVEKHLQIRGGYGAGFIYMGTTRLHIRLNLRC